jgi:predicted nucleic acid-binding protein
VDPGQRDAVLDLLRSVCVWFEPQQRIRDCRDAKDNKYLELALFIRNCSDYRIE